MSDENVTENPPAGDKAQKGGEKGDKAQKGGPKLKANEYLADKHRYYAEEDIEASVGDGGLSVAKYKGPEHGRELGQEIKDETLALQMIAQGQPIKVVTEQVVLKKTYPNPDCPKTGRWAARPGSKLVEP